MIGLLAIWIIHFIFLLFSYMVLQGVAIFFSLLLKPVFPYEKCFFQNPVTYCNMAIYCNAPNTIHNMALICIVSPLHGMIIEICNMASQLIVI